MPEALRLAEKYDAEAEDLTAPILPSERAEQLDHPDVGRSARLDMRKALLLTVESLHSPE